MLESLSSLSEKKNNKYSESVRTEISAINKIDEYIKKLNEYQSHFLIIVAVKGDAGPFSIMNELGSNYSLIAKKKVNYVMLKLNGEKIIDLYSEDIINISYKIDNTLINVSSASYKKGNYSHIIINGNDWSINCRGTNIVVYDLINNRLIDSVNFDTCTPECLCNRTLTGRTLCEIENKLFITQQHYESEIAKNKIICESILIKTFGNNYKKELFAYMPKAEGDLRLYQLATVALFNQFNNFCKENNIEFFLDYGTLLGSFRHGGYVPWDDDIDLGITRNNFDKLFNVIETNDKFSILLYINKHRYVFRISFKNQKFPFIDLFILEFSPYEPQKLLEKHNDIRKRFFEEYRKIFPNLKNKDPCTRAIKAQLDAIRESIIRDEYEYTMTSNVKSVCLSANHWQNNHIQDVNTIFPLKNCIFEGIECKMPSKPEEYLTHLYGDIYSLPDDLFARRHITVSDEKIIGRCKDVIKKWPIE